MAVYGGAWICNGYEICLWLDPNRYRITIWIGSKHVRTFHDKDDKRILKRAFDWANSQPPVKVIYDNR